MLAAVVSLAGGVTTALIGAAVTIYLRRPLRSSVELVDASILMSDDMKLPSLDIKVHNRGGRAAILKRLEITVLRATSMDMDPMPHIRLLRPLPWSATYDLSLPEPDHLDDAPICVDVSHALDANEVDRFIVRLGHGSLVREHKLPEVNLYLIQVVIVYDATNRRLMSGTIAVAVPYVNPVPDPTGDIQYFVHSVREVRQAVDREMRAKGLPTPDWLSSPPRQRDALPENLSTLPTGTTTGRIWFGLHKYKVTENFWRPEDTIADQLASIQQRCVEVLDVLNAAEVVDDELRQWAKEAEKLIRRLPKIRKRCLNALAAP
ncbi:hypothetical protein ACFWF7_32540 [Nocardia sp. NPDC060256]|uniref:hypothetical protein n=1 Tax=unclassified Nocardia TaxID=2637762 RepID=UPI0036517388